MRLVITPPNTKPVVIDTAQRPLPVVVGRDPDEADIAIPDPQASRSHCRIEESGQGLVVEDLGSRNGTWHNDAKVLRCILRQGEVLRVGGTTIAIAEPDPLLGRNLGGYELQEAIGSGGHGTVYRAMQATLGRPVAVKVLPESCSSDPQRVQAFLAEARRAGRLNHPHLVQVHDVLEADGRYLLVMELMAGTVLNTRDDEAPLGESEIITLLRDICRALAYAESQRLVHRDVKPDNILVSEDGTHKLADLGIATVMSEDGKAAQERIFGSPHYVAPEQARGAAIDSRADLYALGASAWHLALGATLFDGSPRQLVAHHIGTPIPDLRKLLPRYQPATVQFVTSLLAKDPGQRPPTAAEALRRIEQLHAAHTMRMATPPPLRRRVRRARPRMR